MTESEKALWEKISGFAIGDQNAGLTFHHRLARENGWTLAYSNQVIGEYRKFIFLSCVSESALTPSDQVDQAWHLHLTYTKSYWKDLCRDTIGKEIHHHPTRGGSEERKKFNDLYSGTLEIYRMKFGVNPPAGIWPQNEERFSDTDFERVNKRKNWIFPKPAYGKLFLSFAVLVLFLMQSCTNTGGGIFAFAAIFLLIYVLGKGLSHQNKGKLREKKRKRKKNGQSVGDDGDDADDGGCSGDSGCSDSGCGSGCGGD